MATKEFTLTADFGTPTVTDNNTKVLIASDQAALALFSDLMGESVDAHWIEHTNPLWLQTGSFGSYGAVESSGELNLSNTPGVGSTGYGRIHNKTWENYVWTTKISGYSQANRSGSLFWGAYQDGDTSDSFAVVLFGRNTSANDKYWLRFLVYEDASRIYAGTYVDLGLANPCPVWLKIERTDYGGTPKVEGFYKLALGDAWISLGSRTTYPPGLHRPGYVLGKAINIGNINIDIDNFIQESGGVYWDDSPTCRLIDSADHSIDAGAGKTLTLSAFASNETTGAGSNVKFRISKSDTNTWGHGGFSAWLTTAQLNTNMGNGDYDGTRYCCLEAQFNSTGAACSLQDATVTYEAVSTGVQLGPFEQQAFSNPYQLGAWR